MGVLAQIALGSLLISFMTFVAFFGRLPALRRTPIAWLHRVLMVHTPRAILALDERLSGGRITRSTGRLGHGMLYGRHPTVLIFFVLLLGIGEYMYLPGAWPRMSTLQKVTAAVCIVLPYWFLYLSAHGDPGVITASTHAWHMSQYPYDFAIFHPGRLCRTCNVPKPARSKHCAVCDRCVAKMDHHCVFINNCVGFGNHGHFILLLATTALLTSYAGILGLGLISDSVRRRHHDAAGWTPWRRGRGRGWADHLALLLLGIRDDAGVGAVTLLALSTTPLIVGLLGYHLYLIYCGTTTNESMKWQDWKAEMDDGLAFTRPLAPDRPRHPRWEAAWTRWPVESVQVLVRTDDGRPPAAAAAAAADDDLPGRGPWERVWKLRDVENLYDLGFWHNLVDVFVPGYPFRQELVTEVERGRRPSKVRGGRAAALADAATAAL